MQLSIFAGLPWLRGWKSPYSYITSVSRPIKHGIWWISYWNMGIKFFRKQWQSRRKTSSTNTEGMNFRGRRVELLYLPLYKFGPRSNLIDLILSALVDQCTHCHGNSRIAFLSSPAKLLAMNLLLIYAYSPQYLQRISGLTTYRA